MNAQLCLDEWDERERVLDALHVVRARLVGEAHIVAGKLALQHGGVTSPEVLGELSRIGYADDLARVDHRFMGAVFRGQEWERVAWRSGPESGASHCRPVAVWRLR
jgi:hypothetical protein